MARYNTNNPVPSNEVKDFSDNSQIVDEIVHLQQATTKDRFGNDLKTWYGIQQEANEAISQYGYITLDSFEDGNTLTLPNQVLRWSSNGEYYRWDGVLPKDVPENSTPDSTGGIGPGAWIGVGDATLRGELASSVGGTMIGMSQGGTLAQNVVTVSVDAFGADPTGATDSSPAVIAALQSVYGTTLDSKYYSSRTKYVQILFGNGTYMLGDIPLIGGTDYVGQGRWATRLIPKAGASYIFKTVGTLPAGDGGGGARYFNGGIREMLIGDRYLSAGLAADVGGIYIANGSYFRLYNIDICRMTGPGLKMEALWDSQFFGLRIMYCGKDAGSGVFDPALYIGHTTTSGGIKEGSNGLQFYGLHLELSTQLLQVDYAAHVLISGPKMEGGPDTVTSCRIDNVQEFCIADAQLTWQKIAYPMFNMVPGVGMDQPTGIHFSSPRIVGNAASPNWVFNYSSTVAPLLISNVTARSVTKLITGANYIIDGGVTYNCGPTIANGGTGTKIIDVVCRQVPAVVTSADNTFIITGTESEVSGCYVQCAGSNSDGAAVIQIASGATDAKVYNNVLAGAKQYGILQNGTVTSKFIRDNVVAPGANIPTLISGSTALYSVVSPNSSGLGNGGVNGVGSVSVANGASTTLSLAAGATLMMVRVVYSVNTAAAQVFVDANTSGIVVGGQTTTGGGTVIQTGSGAAGDGSVRVSKSAGSVTFTNYTGSTLTLNVSTLSAVA